MKEFLCYEFLAKRHLKRICKCLNDLVMYRLDKMGHRPIWISPNFQAMTVELGEQLLIAQRHLNLYQHSQIKHLADHHDHPNEWDFFESLSHGIFCKCMLDHMLIEQTFKI